MRTHYCTIHYFLRTPSDVPAYQQLTSSRSDILLKFRDDELKYLSAALIYFFMDLDKWAVQFEQLEYADPIRPPENEGDKPILYYERLVFFCQFINKPEPTTYQLGVLGKEYSIIKPRKKRAIKSV
jgi:hypothetical protein